MDIILRPGKPEDAVACGTICYEAFKSISGQHNFPADFPSPEAGIGLVSHIFTRSDVYSVVAEVDGRVAGSNFLWELAPIAGVGPITVDPSVQNGSIGRRLMEDVLRRVREQQFAAFGWCSRPITIAHCRCTRSSDSTRGSRSQTSAVTL